MVHGERLKKDCHHLRLEVDRTHMNALQSLGCLMAQTRGDVGAPIAALSDPFAVRIAQSIHQHRPRTRGALVIPSRFRRFAGESVARKSRDDEMKGILRISPVRSRINELANHMSEFQDRARPAMCDQHREGIVVFGPEVQEVELHAVDGRGELRIGIE